MKYYKINKKSDIRYVYVCDGVEFDSDNDVLSLDKIFNETWFNGYKKCDCCENIVATFFIGSEESERGIKYHIYAQTNAENVTEMMQSN